jgi:hypothetical protein
LDQIACSLRDFINSSKSEQILVVEAEVDMNGEEKIPIAPTLKLTVLLEYLSYSPVLPMLLMAIPIGDWLIMALQLLLKHGKHTALENSVSSSISSSLVLFTLHLVSISSSNANTRSRNLLINVMQQFMDLSKEPSNALSADLVPSQAHEMGSLSTSSGGMDWQYFDDDANQISPSASTSHFLSFMFSILVGDHQFAVNSSMVEKMVESLLTEPSISQIRSFSPFLWLMSLPPVLETFIKVISISGPNGERHDMILPMIEGIHLLSSVVPCARPVVLRWLVKEYLFGAGDVNNLMHNSYLPTIIAELISRWILLSHGASTPEMTQFARSVCISHCKPELAIMIETDPHFRGTEWSQSLYELVLDSTYFNDLMIPESDSKIPTNGHSPSATAPTLEKRFSFVISQILENSTSYDSTKQWSAILTKISMSEDAMEVLEAWRKCYDSEVDSVISRSNAAPKTSPMDVNTYDTSDTRVSISHSLGRVAILAHLLSNHLFPATATVSSLSPIHTAPILFFSTLLPAMLQKAKTEVQMIFLAHTTHNVLISSTPILRGVKFTEILQRFTFHDSSAMKSAEGEVSDPDLELLYAINQFFVLVIGLYGAAEGEKSQEDFSKMAPDFRTGKLLELFASTVIHLAACTPGLLTLFPLLSPYIWQAAIAKGSYSAVIQASVGEFASSPFAPTSHTISSLTKHYFGIWKLLCQDRATAPGARRFNSESPLSEDLVPHLDVIHLPSSLRYNQLA